jgi:hypothetical protein
MRDEIKSIFLFLFILRPSALIPYLTFGIQNVRPSA